MRTLIGQTVSHYRVLENLGGGGMGVVYRGQDTRLDRPVALKFLPPELTRDPDARNRFIHEAKAASALLHDRICTVHDIDTTDDGQMFIVMDYYDGETLKKKIARGALPAEEARRIAMQMASGLAEAHRHGLVHRDIKPANIMITKAGDVKILDFGLAKLAGQTTLTRSGVTSGTVGYMSPEQARGEEVGERTDIWSLGIVLQEMLTGKRPFRGEHPMAVLYAVLNEEPGELGPGIPKDLQELCARCLKKNPLERPDDAELLASLSPLPLPRITRYWQIVRSTPALRWGSLILLAGLVVLVIFYFTPARGMKLETADMVVVADFENRTGEHVFDHSLTEAIRVSLRQSTQFTLLPTERIGMAMTLLQIPEGHVLDQAAAILVARREGARAVVAGSISRLGSTYLLSCDIIDGTTGETVKILREEVAKLEAVLSGMDHLCEDLRENLGESLSHISRAHRPLEEVTTRSLQALEYYSRGDRFSSEGEYKQAAMMMEEALALDSTFVMATSELAYAYRKIGNDSLASVYHRRILPLIDRVTEPERLEILATYYGPSFEMNFQKAYELIQQLTVKYPNDAYAFATLGHLAMFAGDTKLALQANARAVQLYPAYDRTCYNNSGFACALEGRPKEALEWFGKAKALRPSYITIDLYMALTHWMNEEYDSSETILRGVFGKADPRVRNQIRVVLSSLLYFRGRLADARALCLEGLSECRRLNRPGDEAYFAFLLAELAGASGGKAEYLWRMKRAAELSVSPFFDLPLLARSYARHGHTAEAKQLLERIQRARSFDPFFLRRQSSFLSLVRGEILLSRGRPQEARKYFDQVEKVQAGDPFYFLARKGAADCTAARGDTSASALYDSILARRGEVIMGSLSSVRFTGFWTRWLWPGVELDLGNSYLLQGRRTLAQGHLSSSAEIWKDADASDLRAAFARKLLSSGTMHQ